MSFFFPSIFYPVEFKMVKNQVAGCSCLGSISQQQQHLQSSSVMFCQSVSPHSSSFPFQQTPVWLPFPQLSKKHLLLLSTEHYLSHPLYLPPICCRLLEVRLKVLHRLFIPTLFSETPAHRSRGPCLGERRAGCLNDTKKKST